MALVLADRVQQTGTANTTTSFTLSGSVTGFQSFAVVGNTNTTFYAAFDSSGNWETGLGTYSTTGPTLTRTTVYASSNSGAGVTFSGTVNVFITYPSGKSVNLDATGNVSALGTVASGTWQATAIGTSYGGSGQTSAQSSMNTFAGAVTSGSYLRGNGTNVVMSTIQAADVPTLNQNTTGTAANITAASNTTLTSLSNLATVGTIGTGTWQGSSISTSYTAAKVTDVQAGTGVSVSSTTGSVTVNIGQAVGTSSNVQFNSVGVGTAGSTTAGEIRATNNITAYYSSDKILKENIQDIPNALEIVSSIGSKTFDWTDAYIQAHGGEDGYFVQKSDFGVIAQDVQAVFPQAVRTREDGTLAVDYEKLGTLAFAAIGQLLKRVEALEAK
jgi:hypothetical protein